MGLKLLLSEQLCSLEMPLGAPAAPLVWGLEESRLRATSADKSDTVCTLGEVAGGSLSPRRRRGHAAEGCWRKVRCGNSPWNEVVELGGDSCHHTHP